MYPLTRGLTIGFVGWLGLAACSSATPTQDAGADGGIPDGGCDTTAAVDTCPPGTYCTGAGPLDRYGTCLPPGELDLPCVPDAGCNGAGLVCMGGFRTDGGTESFCVYQCSLAADCPGVDTTCINPGNGDHNFCYFNYCGPGATTPNGTGYYDPCDSGGPLKSDALCFPDQDVASGATFGLCEAAGSAPVGTACQRTRVNDNTAALCVLGSKCFLGSSGGTRCLPVCAAVAPYAADGGPGCAADEVCYNEFTSWGYCVQVCTSSSTCPTGTHCSVLGQGISGCLP